MQSAKILVILLIIEYTAAWTRHSDKAIYQPIGDSQ